MKIATNANRKPLFYGLLTVLFMVFILFPDYVFAQSLSEFDQAVSTETTTFKSIAKNIFDIIFVIGAISVVYAYVSKRQDAKEYLIMYFVGVIIYGVLRQSILK